MPTIDWIDPDRHRVESGGEAESGAAMPSDVMDRESWSPRPADLTLTLLRGRLSASADPAGDVATGRMAVLARDTATATAAALRLLSSDRGEAGARVAFEIASAIADKTLLAQAADALAERTDSAAGARGAYRLASALLRVGRRAEADRAADRIDAGDPWAERARRSITADREAIRAAEADPVRIDRSLPILSTRIADARTLVVAFGYPNGNHFGLAAAHLRALCTALGASSLLLLDPRLTLFGAGVPPLAGTYADLVRAVGDVRARWGIARLVTLGTCTGGFPALRLGLDAGADHVIALSPIASTRDWTTTHERRGVPYLPRLRAVGSGAMMDLPPRVQAASVRPATTVWYGCGTPEGIFHSSQFVGTPGIDLRMAFGPKDTRLAAHLQAIGAFTPLLAAAIDGEPIEAGLPPADDVAHPDGFAVPIAGPA